MIVVHGEQNITEYITSMSWGGSRSEVARKLELSVVNAPLDDNITPLTMGLADPIYLFEDDGITELFRGFITDREANSTTGTVTYTAHDLLYYTLKSKATYNFSGYTAEAVARTVCGDMEIPVGSLATTGLKNKLIVQNVGIYGIIMQAYTQAHQKNGKKYRVNAKKGKLNVEEMGKVVCELELAEDSNIISSKYKESLNNMVNKVRIYDGEGNQTGVVQNDEDLQYGIFQQTYTKEEGKDPVITAKSLFSGVEKTFNLECVNYNGAVTGAGAIVNDSSTGLRGLVWIDADTHTWKDGVATMSLTVTLKQMMDSKEAQNSNSTEDTTEDSTPPKATNTYGSKTNPPFAVLNKYYRSEREGISTWNEAYVHYMSNSGTANGWKIVDKDRKEVLL